MVFAIIDTNVLVSYFISKDDGPPTWVVRNALGGMITPVFSSYLLNEYRKVLIREKFNIRYSSVISMIDAFLSFGFGIEMIDSMAALPDKDDTPIYEIALSTRDIDSYLVTGNTNHFPKDDFVVTPKEFMDILKNKYRLESEQFDLLNAEYRNGLSSANDEKDWIPLSEVRKRYGGSK